MRNLMEGVTAAAKRVLLLNLLYKRWSERRNNSDDDDTGDMSNQRLEPNNSTLLPSSPLDNDHHTDPDDRSTTREPLAREYEAFLSFRGPDTRFGITDILYRFLCQLKIHTFIDESELRRGEVIWGNLARGIDQSKVYVAIFSNNYASSKWCLKELAEMVRRRKEDNRRIIFPIFYEVNPNDVRHQTGPYKKAFQQHEKNFDKKIVQEWKDALTEVGSLKGNPIKSNDHKKAETAEYVANLIWSHLRKDNDTLQTDKLVGIDSHVEEVVKRLSLDSQNVAMVGLHGMGGIGKTTLAKAVYNKIFAKFDRCSFLENIREKQQENDGNLEIQKHLIYDAMRREECVLDVDNGRRIIRNRVCQFKILVVLDDVDEKFKFDEIFGKPRSFFPGSRFIVTSRNNKVLSTLNEDRCELYEVQGLSLPLSLQLFSKHAFKRNSPPLDYVSLSNDIVSILGGLPLTLEVVGSLLYGEDKKKVWKEKLAELKEIPPIQVIDRLKISYDALEYEAKQIFLDIACFYIDEEKQKPFYMWSDCNLYPANNTNLLIQRSMLKIGGDNRFQMHDQIRDMGREIVRRENIERPWMMRSRIWSDDRALELLQDKKGTIQVQAIRVNSSWGNHELKSEYFVNLSELRYFEAASANLAGDFTNLLPNLRWFRMVNLERSDRRRLINLQMEKLVILELCSSEVGNDWGGWRHIKKAKKLKVLDLQSCKNLTRLPELPESGSLEMLDLTNFSLGRSEGYLDVSKLMNLILLCLNSAFIRKIVGGTIGMIEELRELDVTSCECVNLGQALHDVWKLQSLQILKTSSANLMHGLGEQVLTGKLPTSLKVLTTSSPINNLSELTELESLEVAHCDCGLEIPPINSNEWWKSSKLKALEIYNASKMWSVDPDNALLPSSLTRLRLTQCGQLEWLPNLANLEKLTELTFNYCPRPPEIPGLGGLKSLQTLEISYGVNLRRLDGLHNLRSLTSLILQNCEMLEKLPFSSNNNNAEAEMHEASTLLRELKNIKITYCRLLTEIQGIGGLKSLQTLEISYAANLRRLGGLHNLPSLTTLILQNCDALEKLSLSSNHAGVEESTLLRKLHSVNITSCRLLTEIQGIRNLTSLQHLYIDRAESLTRIDGLGNLLSSSSSNSLISLYILDCPLLRSLSLTQDDADDPDDIGHDEQSVPVAECLLQQLVIQGCTSLLEGGLQMPHLSMFPMLRVLKLTDLTIKVPTTEKLRASSTEQQKDGEIEKELVVLPLQGLECLQQLEELELANLLPSIERLPSLSKLRNLREVTIEDLPALREIEGLAGLKLLRKLDLTGCTSLENLALDQLSPRLEFIGIRGCTNLLTDDHLSALCNLPDGVDVLLRAQDLRSTGLCDSYDYADLRLRRKKREKNIRD